MTPIDLTYVLPLRRERIADADELPAYLEKILDWVRVIVVDGSPSGVFEHHRARLPRGVMHIPVDGDRTEINGKVRGVMTGMLRVTTFGAVIADDDVRYDRSGLELIGGLLSSADLVRPQNYFEPLVWHALLDTGRTLIARATGGDWSGTMAVRKTSYWRAGGYSGDALFENLELERTIEATGGTSLDAADCFVARRPPSANHYLRQRVRQAYDEFARPRRLLCQLAILPAVGLAVSRGWGVLGVALAACVILAEVGRRKAGGRSVFPAAASWLAPIWVLERGFTCWIALFGRLFHGGIDYGDRKIRLAAHSVADLRRGLAI